jgi:CBS domain-containing protein
MARDIIQIKSRIIETISPEKTVGDAVAMLAKHKIGLLVVCKKENQLAGVLSERDVVQALGKNGASCLDFKVGAVLTKDVVTCNGAAHPHDVLTQMHERNIRHMPVVEKGKLVGIVTSRDILEHLAKNTSPDEQAMMWAKMVQM